MQKKNPKRLICAQKEEKGRNIDKFVQIRKTIKEPFDMFSFTIPTPAINQIDFTVY